MTAIDHDNALKAIASRAFDRLSVKRLNVHVDESSKTLFLPIPKNANSFLKSIFLHNAPNLSFDYQKQTPLQFSKQNHGYYPVVCDSRILSNPAYKKILVLRQPERRLLSCYLDKVVKKLPGQHGKINKILKKKSQDITFFDFAYYVSQIPDFKRDRHYRSQSLFTATRVIHFDFVGCVENLDNTLNYLANERGMDVFRSENPGVTKKTEFQEASQISGHTHFANVPASQLLELGRFPHPNCFFDQDTGQLIRKTYEKDFDLYRYYFPEVENSTNQATTP